jgi:hypothetical protein
LEQSLKFDPLTRQVDQLANGMKELPFDTILAGIKSNQASIKALTPTLDAQTAAVAKQQAVVDKATVARDQLERSYDRENDKLGALTDTMQKYLDKANDIKDALSGLSAAASDAAAKHAKAGKSGNQSPAAAAFDAAAKANYPAVGGKASIGREGGPGDQSKLIDQFTQDINGQVAAMFGKFDLMAPLKKKWSEFTSWMKGTGIGGQLSDAVSGIPEVLSSAWDKIDGKFKLSELFDFGDDFKGIWQSIKDSFKIVSDAFDDFKKRVGLDSQQTQRFLNGLKVVFFTVLTFFLLTVRTTLGTMIAILKPLIIMVGKVIGAIITILAGVIQFIQGVFMGDWQRMWEGIKTIFLGIWDAMAAILEGAVKIVIDVVWGFVKSIVKFFQWLYDVLVGHSIIPDLVNAIVSWFGELYHSVVKWVSDLVKKVVEWFKALPGSAWNALRNLASKLKDRAGTAFSAFWQKMKTYWTSIKTWIQAIPMSAWNGLKELSTKLKDRAGTAFSDFWQKMKTYWTSIKTWIQAIPGSAWNALKDFSTKLADRARTAFNSFKTVAKNIVDGKNGLMAWVKGIPGRIGSALGGIGGAIANSIKTSWNTAAGWLNKNGIANINKITEKIGFHMNSLPTFAKGGVVPGATSRKDNVLAGLRSGEGVIVPEAVRALGGRDGLERLNRAAERGQLFMEPEGRKKADPHMGDGIGSKLKGMANNIGDWAKSGAGFALSHLLGPLPGLMARAIPGDSLVEKVGVSFLRDVKDKLVHFGNSSDGQPGHQSLGHLGYMWQEKVLKEAFPYAQVSSGFRPNAITSSGNLSYHALGRAIDIVPTQMKIFDWIWRTYGGSSKELIYTPAGKKQLKDGKSHVYSGQVAADHYDHIHWAYDQGGFLKPGMGRYVNRTGKPEPVFTSRQWSTLRQAINGTGAGTGGLLGTAGGAGSGTGGSRVVLRIASATVQIERLDNGTDRATLRGDGGDTYNFYGDLEFPNITNGGDAEEFTKNLRNLKGGR